MLTSSFARETVDNTCLAAVESITGEDDALNWLLQCGDQNQQRIIRFTDKHRILQYFDLISYLKAEWFEPILVLGRCIMFPEFRLCLAGRITVTVLFDSSSAMVQINDETAYPLNLIRLMFDRSCWGVTSHRLGSVPGHQSSRPPYIPKFGV